MKKNLGFTLIELLVVIAVLAVLAAGVVVAINPGKRIRQANDAKIRNDIGQISTALQAYYTTNQTYPTVAQVTAGQLVTSGDLKQMPTTPAGGAYSYAVPAGGCAGTVASPCTESALWTGLNDPAAVGNLWCWRSSQGSASEVGPTACTAP